MFKYLSLVILNEAEGGVKDLASAGTNILKLRDIPVRLRLDPALS